MPKGVYAAASAMLTEMRALDVRARNLSNARTAGYRREEPLVEGFAATLAARGRVGGIDGDGGAGVTTRGSTFRFNDGELEQTNQDYDLGLSGDGFLVVRDPAGKLWLSRLGDLTVDTQNRLTTKEGWTVQGQGGDITIPNGALKVAIDERGRIDAQTVDGPTTLDQIRIATVDRPQDMRAIAGIHFDPGTQPLRDGTARVHQGTLERANVDTMTEMVEMIALQRRYDAAQKAISEQTSSGVSISDMLRG